MGLWGLRWIEGHWVWTEHVTVDDDIFIKRAFAPIGLLEIHAAFSQIVRCR